MRPSFTTFLICLLGLGLSSGLHAQSLLTVPHANEPSVAINPTNPLDVVVATNVDRFYHSSDGGREWKDIQPTSPYGIHGDPVLHYVGDQLYFAHLSKTKGKAWGAWFDRIVVQRIDEVDSWQEHSYSVGYNNGKMQDKPWLSGDTFLSSPYRQSVYVSWTEFDVYGSSNPSHHSRIRFSALRPGDSTFSPAVTVSDSTGDCLDGDHTLEGAVTTVGPDGIIYMVWAGHDKIWFDQSTDGGRTWGKDRVIATQQGGWAMDIPHLFRANAMPFIQLDRGGRLAVVYSETVRDFSMLRIIHSSDQGQQWTQVPLVSKPTQQYLPNLIANADGLKSLHIDHGRSPSGFFFDVILSHILWMGDHYTLSTYPVNPDPIPLPGNRVFFGDYIDLDQVDETTIAVYTSFDGQRAVVETRAAADARKSAGASIQLSWVVDRDSAHLVYRSVHNFRLKGELHIHQGDASHMQRVDMRIKGPSRNAIEGVILSLPLDPAQAVTLSWEATICKGWFSTRRQISQELVYP